MTADILLHLSDHFRSLQKEGKRSDTRSLEVLCEELLSSSCDKVIKVICSLKDVFTEMKQISPILCDFAGFCASYKVLEKIAFSSVQKTVFVDFIAFIWNLPTRLANVNQGHLPKDLKRQNLVKTMERLACVLLKKKEVKKTCVLLDLIYANSSSFDDSSFFLHQFAHVILTGADLAQEIVKNLRYRSKRNLLESFLNFCPTFSFSTLVQPLQEIFLAKSFNLLRLCVGRLLGRNGQFHLGRIVAAAGYEVWKALVDYWADENIVSKVSVEQRIQVAKIIAFGVDYLPKLTNKFRPEIISSVSSGFRNHLAQSASNNRDIGMLTAKKIVSVFDPETKLDFQITNSELASVLIEKHDDCRQKTIKFLEGENEEESVTVIVNNEDEDDNESLDSDDLEFEQFEFETPNLSKFSPRFLLEASGILVDRNLTQSMSESEKSKRKVAALERIPYLARVNEASSKELVDELLTGITHFEIIDENDSILVEKALISLAFVAPTFYAPAISSNNFVKLRF